MYSDTFKRVNEFNVCALMEGRELWDIKQKTLKGTQHLEKNTKSTKLFALLTLRSSAGEMCRLQESCNRFAVH